jgi:hypothetical protein
MKSLVAKGESYGNKRFGDRTDKTLPAQSLFLSNTKK